MGNQEIIDRDTYRKIKKMNREELTKFILRYGDQLLVEHGKTIDLPALEAELKVLEQKMTSSDFDEVRTAGDRYKEIQLQLEEKYPRWEELAERLC